MTGKPKSGKSKFVSYAIDYIRERKEKDSFEYHDISEDYRKNKNKTEKEVIKKSKQSKAKLIVFMLGKITSNEYEKFSDFYVKVMKEARSEKIKFIITTST